jgi:hypothetical protein
MSVIPWALVSTAHLGDRIQNRVDGVLLCNVCATTQRVGDSGPRDTPAVWVWYAPIGNVSYLCDECFVWWSRFAAEPDADPLEKPSRYHRVRREMDWATYTKMVT